MASDHDEGLVKVFYRSLHQYQSECAEHCLFVCYEGKRISYSSTSSPICEVLVYGNMQQHHHTTTATTTGSKYSNFTHHTNTAKLPIDVVKKLIASVSQRPNLWIRTNNGQKRSDINLLWQQVSSEVHLPADICRIKWGHLRDNFRKVFIRNTLSSEPPTTWRFYNDMRFMEPAVAENVMRHHRLREQSFYWQELHNAGQRQHRINTSNSQPESQYDNTLHNQFNFSEFAAIFQNNASSPANKRIKLEPSESSETSMPDDDGDDDDDDDQFDEDAVSAEENLQSPNNDSKEINDKSAVDEPILSDGNPVNKITIANFKMHQEMATNTESSSLETVEEDSDRMFLLSLLPYLRKVNEQRKLHVRQKLQDVLIKEFG
ncbi:uncharacterized protein LOC133336465 [Musca vetustissima]|uniref:uncharacterized protein LOC133336465 n=1 Tax=Musca vetustissima TaxID=27455 RepID=UPI002AB72A9E|nr:uncharacterized protein LOC133336465 [Musca vetustissima]